MIIIDELRYLVRIMLALGLGFAIGFERKIRNKEAGIRTHTIVSVGSCLFMLISKCARGDGDQHESLDIRRGDQRDYIRQ